MGTKSQEERFTSNGWDSANCWNMNEVYSLLPQREVQRVEAIERLDERQLLCQLFHHYGLTVARKKLCQLQLRLREFRLVSFARIWSSLISPLFGLVFYPPYLD